MPLRDHFRPPVSDRSSYQELHGQWPAVIVQHLKQQLPPGFTAGPKVHLGSQVEIDIATYESMNGSHRGTADSSGGETATAVWTGCQPVVAVSTELPDDDEYEVRVYDARTERRLVAAIEIVSPGNKDRPEKRNAFIGKCAALLRNGVAVSIVDTVTIRPFNLHAQLMTFVGHPDPTMTSSSPEIYASSCRWVQNEQRPLLEAWSFALRIGEPLPKLPLWLGDNLVVDLELEPSYEQACRDLWIE